MKQSKKTKIQLQNILTELLSPLPHSHNRDVALLQKKLLCEFGFFWRSFWKNFNFQYLDFLCSRMYKKMKEAGGWESCIAGIKNLFGCFYLNFIQFQSNFSNHQPEVLAKINSLMMAYCKDSWIEQSFSFRLTGFYST